MYVSVLFKEVLTKLESIQADVKYLMAVSNQQVSNQNDGDNFEFNQMSTLESLITFDEALNDEATFKSHVSMHDIM